MFVYTGENYKISYIQGKFVPKEYERVLPASIFGSLVIVGGIASFILPETTGYSLPETIEEAAKFPE